MKNTLQGKWELEELNKRKQNETGLAAPDFTVKTSIGQEVSLSKLKGKFVLLDFWASWCIPCREAIPNLKRIYNKYHSKGMEIITISIDAKKKDWENALAQERIGNWYNVLANEEINKGYDNSNLPIPSQILIDPVFVVSLNSSIKKNLQNYTGAVISIKYYFAVYFFHSFSNVL